MKNILVIESSPRGRNSYSRKLSQAIVGKLKEKDANMHIENRDLVNTSLPHLGESHLTAFFSSPETHSESDKRVLHYSDKAVDELLRADIIIVEIPMYNFGIPSTLKVWVDHIVRAGRTFNFTAKGAEGLVKGKKVYLAIATGGIYSEGPMKGNDFTESYMRTVLAHIGITDVTTFRVEGIAIPGIQDTALERAVTAVSHLD